MPIKPKLFCSFANQVRRLKTVHGLQIGDDLFAERVLQTVPYYDLINGYKEATMVKDVFKPNISFEYLYMLYFFDRSIQSLLFQQSVFLENSFKTKLAYVIAQNYGVQESKYLDPCHYLPQNNAAMYSTMDGNGVGDKILSFCNSTFLPQPSRHYRKKHGHIPPWILFKNISFSVVINLFSLLKGQDKQAVMDMLLPPSAKVLSHKEQVQFTISAMNIIRKYRNSIAHNLKFVTYHPSFNDKLAISAASKIFSPTLVSKSMLRRGSGVNDIFAFILSLFAFIRDPYQANIFCEDLLSRIMPKDQSDNEQVKSILFADYAVITRLPQDLPNRIITYQQTIPQN